MLWLRKALCWSHWWPGNITDPPLGAFFEAFGQSELWVWSICQISTAIPASGRSLGKHQSQLSPPCSCPPLPRGLNSSSFHTAAGYTLIMQRFIPPPLTIKGAAVGWNSQPKPAPLDRLPESAGPPPAQTSAPRAAQSQLELQRGGKAFLQL